MCRLFYIRSTRHFEMSNHLNMFAQIAKNSKEFQGHGWGCAYLRDGNWNIYKNLNPIWEDDMSIFGTSRLLIAHARSAFKDRDLQLENNMPFFNGDFIFVFNGELHGVKIKESGKIGAEKIFNYIMRFYTGNLEEAMQRSIEIIKKRSRYVKAMNLLIADKETAYVSSDFNEDPDYFTLFYKKSVDKLIISSEEYPDGEDWHKIEPGTVKVF